MRVVILVDLPLCHYCDEPAPVKVWSVHSLTAQIIIFPPYGRSAGPVACVGPESAQIKLRLNLLMYDNIIDWRCDWISENGRLGIVTK